jgi:hypothetical protein
MEDGAEGTIELGHRTAYMYFTKFMLEAKVIPAS